MDARFTTSLFASRRRRTLPHVSQSKFLQPGVDNQLQSRGARRRESAENILLPSNRRAAEAFSRLQKHIERVRPGVEDSAIYNSDGDDGESSQPGDEYIYGSYQSSETSDAPVMDEDTGQRLEESGLREEPVGESTQLEVLGTGAVFESSTPSRNPDDSADDEADVLAGGNPTDVSVFRLVRDQPSIIYQEPGAAASDVLDGWAIEDARSQGSIARSAVSLWSGSDKDLQARLMSARAENPVTERLFYPRSVLTSIISEECVEQELRRGFPDRDDVFIKDQTHKICTKEVTRPHGPGQTRGKATRCFKRIFVILVQLDRSRAIKDFIDHDVNDSDLPLQRLKRPGEDAIFDLCRYSEPKKPLKFITEHLSMNDIEIFWEKQWTILAPYFTERKAPKKVWHYKLSSHAILPYIHPDKTSAGGGLKQKYAGGSAEVSRVYIHHKHHNLQNRKSYSGSFALKHLHSSCREAFNDEVDMLKRFSHNQDEHLVSLLLTYEQNDTFFLLFDWAECNLKDYWQIEQPNPDATDRETVLWVGRQCQGIAHGVLYLHRYQTISHNAVKQSSGTVFGHHGDIKEENILWYPGAGPKKPNKGKLKLADFGVARFSAHRTSPLDKDAFFKATPSYRSPESDLDTPSAQGRSYDIWTLGILYLQLITWLLGGWDALQKFKTMRKCVDPGWYNLITDTFFERNPETTGNGPHGGETCHIIKPVVTQFFKDLHRNPLCTDFLHDFLRIIEEQMLIVKKTDSTERDRIEAAELHAKLKEMVDRCEVDDEYACDVVLWN